MSNKVLFFGHRHDHFSYFSKIVKHSDSFSLLMRSEVKFSIFDLKLPARESLKRIVDYEQRSVNADFRRPRIKYALRPIETFFRVVKLYSAYFNYLKDSQFSAVVVWGGYRIKQSPFILAANDLGIKVIYLENGYLPNTTQVDQIGVNAQSSLSREPSFYLNSSGEEPDVSLPESLVKREAVRLKSDSDDSGKLPSKYIFVPFQVNSDAQILINSPRIKNMEQFFEEVCTVAKHFEKENVFFIFKEHPSCEVDYSDLYQRIKNEKRQNVKFINSISTETLIKRAEAVITINSSVGMESLLFSKPVICLGNAVYGIDGLAFTPTSEQEITSCIQEILHGWQANEALRKKFLLYLYNDYLVHGSEKYPSEEHFLAMAKRIQTLAGVQ